MTKLLAFLRIIRLPNLLMIGLAQLVTAKVFVQHFEYQQLFQITMATIFIAIGGYILNDMEDIKIDIANRKEAVTKYFSIPTLKAMYYLFSAIGLSVAFYLAWQSKMWFVILFIFAFFMLFSYAKFFSKFKLIGNIFVSFLVAEAIIIVPIIANITHNTPSSKEEVYLVVLPAYTLLAFLFNWMREIIKDLEDQEGDELENRVTVPSVFGADPSKIVVFALIFMASPLIILQLFHLHYYLLVAIVLLIGIMIFKLKKATEKTDFKAVSLIMKIIMLLGILYPLV